MIRMRVTPECDRSKNGMVGGARQSFSGMNSTEDNEVEKYRSMELCIFLLHLTQHCVENPPVAEILQTRTRSGQREGIDPEEEGL